MNEYTLFQDLYVESNAVWGEDDEMPNCSLYYVLEDKILLSNQGIIEWQQKGAKYFTYWITAYFILAHECGHRYSYKIGEDWTYHVDEALAWHNGRRFIHPAYLDLYDKFSRGVFKSQSEFKLQGTCSLGILY